MNYESMPQSGTGELSGHLSLSTEERAVLEEKKTGSFEPHPKFAGVELMALEAGEVPARILEIIKDLGGSMTTCSAVRIQNEIPLHQHTTDGEIYFGGRAVVTLLDGDRNELGTVELQDDGYTVTKPGEWHGIKSLDEGGTVFFGAKFEVGDRMNQ